MDGADAPTSTAIVEGADADDGEKERRAPKLAAVVERTDADNAESNERESSPPEAVVLTLAHRAFAFHSYIHMPEWTNPVYVLQLSITRLLQA